LRADIPLFSCLVRWDEGDSLWEVALPYYALHPEYEYIWTSVPNRYCVDANLLRAITAALREHHVDSILNKCHVFFIYDGESVELNEDGVIMDVLIQYSDI
jgi:hypothetical protein